MDKRPIAPVYIKIIRKEEPGADERKQLMRLYRKGGIAFEPDVAKKMGDIDIHWGAVLDTRSKRFIEWTYVGDHWWARKRSGRYEFGKLVAAENKLNSKDLRIVGLWDERKHGEDDHPVIVYKEGQKGYVVGYNKYEMLIQWIDEFENRSIPKAWSNVGKLDFQYEQDQKFFYKLFGRIKHASS